jgi:hypothetical protein
MTSFQPAQWFLDSVASGFVVAGSRSRPEVDERPAAQPQRRGGKAGEGAPPRTQRAQRDSFHPDRVPVPLGSLGSLW